MDDGSGGCSALAGYQFLCVEKTAHVRFFFLSPSSFPAPTLEGEKNR
jgi:hypothetical protein